MNQIVEQKNTKAALSTGGSVSAIVPRDIEQAFRLSDAIHQAGMSPYGMDSPQKIMIAMLAGMEVGLPPMASVQSVAVINNRPCMWGDALIGVVRNSDVCEYVREWIDGEGDKMVAWCETKRKGETGPVKSSFSVEDAKRAGLWQTEARIQKRAKGGGTYEAANDSPWFKYPKRMLQMRARSWCLRDTYADILKGMQVREEVEDYPDRHVGADNAKDVTPSIVGRLKAAKEASEQSTGASEGFSDGFVRAETGARTGDDETVDPDTGEIEDNTDDASSGSPVADDASAGEDAPASTQSSPATNEPDRDFLVELFQALYAAKGPDPDVVDAQSDLFADRFKASNVITQRKAKTILTQIKMLGAEELDEGECIEYLAGVIGVDPKEMVKVPDDGAA